VVVAFSDREIGLDVEKIKGDRRKIAQRFFTPSEINDMETAGSQKEQVSYFYQLWTLKESYMKAIGKGMSMSLSSFAFKKEKGGFKLAFSAHDPDWAFYTPQWEDEYYLSICSKAKDLTEQKTISLAELNEMIS
ncbi:MAG: 4'-phosphopantetheinyl transferase superfamily protein, partial [Bacteroidales bacterium]|nr:4'-phosphopantetheinyl transferase superfamily protein [Bacteroidales bacterium]